MIIILYQICSEHTKWGARFASKKANMILNCLEVVFWAAVVFLMIQANLNFCVGTNCTISWAVVGVSGTLSVVAAWTAVVSINEWRHAKKMGGKSDEEIAIKNETIEDGRSFQ